jgi:mannose-6-phosphate isomerase-like protein (cupin superfamily)
MATRRVVTGHDENGKAIVIEDGPAPFVHRNPARPDYSSTDIWRTHAMPAAITARADEPTLGPRRQLPTRNGTVVRINVMPPDDDSIDRMSAEQSQAFFASLGNAGGATFGKGGRHPMMHRTETIDYAIVIDGEVTMLLDDSEVVLRAGDVLVQCGTNHAWVNRSGKPCTIAFVLVDGAFDEPLRESLADDH